MKEKGSNKPEDSRLKNDGSEDQSDLSDDIGTVDSTENGVADMNCVAEPEVAYDLNEDVDWSLTGILNHPSGVDFALKQNAAIMEQRTKDLIENGSIEDLLAALEENNRQLEMLKDRMDGSLGWLTNNMAQAQADA